MILHKYNVMLYYTIHSIIPDSGTLTVSVWIQIDKYGTSKMILSPLHHKKCSHHVKALPKIEICRDIFAFHNIHKLKPIYGLQTQQTFHFHFESVTNSLTILIWQAKHHPETCLLKVRATAVLSTSQWIILPHQGEGS